MEIQDCFVNEKHNRLDRLIDSSLKELKKDQYVNDIKAAEILDCSPQTLRNYRHLGKGPAYTKRGRMIRYRVQDPFSYMAAGRMHPEGRE
jgi:Helix-turn-helix domain